MSNDCDIDVSKSDVSVDECPALATSVSHTSVLDRPAIIELQSFQESELSDFVALEKPTELTEEISKVNPFSAFKRGFSAKKETLHAKKRRRTSRLKSIIHAGMASSRINHKKRKIKVVHDDHSHGHDKHMFHPLKTFK